MTDDEKARFNAMESQVAEIHAALFKPQIGESRSTIEKLNQLVKVSEKGTWAVSWAVKVILTIGAIVAALGAIKTGIINR